MYYEKIDLNNQLAQKYLVLADKYLIHSLKSHCVNYLKNNLTMENIIDTILFADKYEVSDLKQFCFRKIYSEIPKVLEGEDIARLSKDLMLEMMKSMASSRPQGLLK